MKIEVGKVYKTKCGKRVTVMGDGGNDDFLCRLENGDEWYFTSRGYAHTPKGVFEIDFANTPFVIEVGKYYRTRDGQKAFVAGRTPFDGNEYPLCGFIEGVGSESWLANGSYISGGSDGFDLVAEWKEPPKRIKGWVNIYPPTKCNCGTRYDNESDSPFVFGSHHYATKCLADKYATCERIACVKIDVLEGEGL